MRTWLPLLVLVGIVLSVVASSRASAQAQSPHAGITVGETISVAFEANGGGRDCTVIDVRGDFIGCQAPSPGVGRPAVEHWFNLRLVVARIDRRVER
ncbi:MAG TPA: hypothetical protein VFK57_22845 [Vicinamibacterales bacterium]|nr:hypothetical protein [Vicinamibacterales bacterium]